jgi:hypothetical protein
MASTIRPASSGREISGPDAAFLQQLPGLPVDGLHAVDRIGPDIGVAEEPGEPDRAGPQEPVEDLRIGRCHIECAGPAVLVVEQRIPAAQVGEGSDPAGLGGSDQLGTAAVTLLDLAILRLPGPAGLRLPGPAGPRLPGPAVAARPFIQAAAYLLGHSTTPPWDGP